MTRKVWKQIAKLIRVEGKEILREETTYKQKLVKFELKRFRLLAAAAATQTTNSRTLTALIKLLLTPLTAKSPL